MLNGISYFKEGDITNCEVDINTINRRFSSANSPMKSINKRDAKAQHDISHSKVGLILLNDSNEYTSPCRAAATADTLPDSLKSSINSSISCMKVNRSLSEEDQVDIVRSRLSSRNGFKSGVSSLGHNIGDSYIKDSCLKSRPSSSYVPPSRYKKSIVRTDQMHCSSDDDSAGVSCTGNKAIGYMMGLYGNDECDNINSSDSDDGNIISHTARHQLMSSHSIRRPSSSPYSMNSNLPSRSLSHDIGCESTAKVSSRYDRTSHQRDFYEEPIPSDLNMGRSRPSTGDTRRSDSNSRESKSTMVNTNNQIN